MTYYEELGVPQDASLEDIRQAYKMLARLLHPDSQAESDLKPMADRQMQRLVELVTVLSDPEKRSRYDELISLGNRLPPASKRPVLLPRPRGWRYSNNAAAEFALRHWFWILNGAFVVTLGAWAFLQSSPALPDHPGWRVPASEHVPLDRHAVQKAQPPRRRTSAVNLKAPAVIPRDGIPNAARPSLPAPPKPLPEAPELESIPPGSFSAPDPLALVAKMAKQDVAPVSGMSSFAGRWLYTPQLGDARERGMYSAMYVELLLVDHGGELAGDYRARYRVPDRAVSPEVAFKIRGTAESVTSATFGWSSGDHAKGQAEMTLRTPNLLYISWWTTEFGRRDTLASGTAVLLRVQTP